MKFAGLIKNSFVDYPNEIAAVAFVLGCNFNCGYCHNREIIDKENKSINLISEEEILTFLKNRTGFLDGLVITGGEPTIYKDLKNFIIKVKNLGLKVKLDTNGNNPELLNELLQENLIDFVAMDIKTSLEKYDEIAGVKVDTEKIKQSIDLLMNSNINYEFRTTFTPDVLIEDIEKIAKMVSGAKAYVIQKFNPVKNIEGKVIKLPHSLNQFRLANERAKNYVNSSLRSIS